MDCQNIIKLVILTGVLAALLGCSKGEDQASAPKSQVVAHVGSQVITTQEMDTEFRFANVPNDKRQDPQIVRRILGDLTTRKYLVEQALSAKLDREPSVLLELLRGREQILASTFLSRKALTRASAVTKAEIDKFISNNPARFADRKALFVDQIAVPINAADQSVLEAVKSLSSIDEVDQRLTTLGVPHNRSTGTLNTSDLPNDLSRSIQARKPEDVFFVRAGQAAIFFQVKNETPAPLVGENAFAVARQLLGNEMLTTEASMARLSASSEAKYEGEYASIMKDDKGK
jgi:EpsD family peptidyl-prolyl cis-trans isomerase